jgi:hypothetical protein
MNTFDKIVTVISPLGKSVKDLVSNKEMFVDDEQVKTTGSVDVAPITATPKVPLKVENPANKKKLIIFLVTMFVNFLLGIICAVLCWRVNTNTFLPFKLLFVLFAFFFFPFYLIYYTIVHLISQKFGRFKSDNTVNVSNPSLLVMKPNVNTNTNMPNTYIASNSKMNK